jgi:hypothetical protein
VTLVPVYQTIRRNVQAEHNLNIIFYIYVFLWFLIMTIISDAEYAILILLCWEVSDAHMLTLVLIWFHWLLVR